MIYILIVPAVLAVWAVATYNRFVRLHRLADEAWSGISVQLKRRYDLIPNLVETVKGFAKQEQGVLEEVTRMRTAVGSANSQTPTADLAKAENALGGAVGRLLAVAEAYPDLKSNQNFLALQKELSDVEDQLQMARRYYNGTVRSYMTAYESFPSVLIARALSFSPKEFFELDDVAEKAAPKVAF